MSDNENTNIDDTNIDETRCNYDRNMTRDNNNNNNNNNNNSVITLPFFKQCIRTGAHAKSVLAVLNREADVLCLDEHIHLALFQSQGGRDSLAQLRPIAVPSLTRDINLCQSNDQNLFEGLRTLAHSYQIDSVLSTADGRLGPNPLQPVLASNRLSSQLQQRIRNAFLEVHLSVDIKQFLSAECYVVIDQRNYDFVKYMLHEREEECRKVLPPVLCEHDRIK